MFVVLRMYARLPQFLFVGDDGTNPLKTWKCAARCFVSGGQPFRLSPPLLVPTSGACSCSTSICLSCGLIDTYSCCSCGLLFFFLLLRQPAGGVLHPAAQQDHVSAVPAAVPNRAGRGGDARGTREGMYARWCFVGCLPCLMCVFKRFFRPPLFCDQRTKLFMGVGGGGICLWSGFAGALGGVSSCK